MCTQGTPTTGLPADLTTHFLHIHLKRKHSPLTHFWMGLSGFLEPPSNFLFMEGHGSFLIPGKDNTLSQDGRPSRAEPCACLQVEVRIWKTVCCTCLHTAVKYRAFYNLTVQLSLKLFMVRIFTPQTWADTTGLGLSLPWKCQFISISLNFTVSHLEKSSTGIGLSNTWGVYIYIYYMLKYIHIFSYRFLVSTQNSMHRTLYSIPGMCILEGEEKLESTFWRNL